MMGTENEPLIAIFLYHNILTLQMFVLYGENEPLAPFVFLYFSLYRRRSYRFYN